MSQRSFQERGTGRRRQDRIIGLVESIVDGTETVPMIRRITEIVCQEMQAERATIYMVKEDTQELESVHSIGNVPRVIRVPIREDSLAGYCALTKRSYVVKDAYGDLSYLAPRIRFDRSWDEASGFRTRDVMCVPAVFRHVVQGVIQVINAKDGVFQEHDLVPLQTLGRMIGYAIHNARLFNELQTLKQVDRKNADFMRIMVHELKSPVAAAKMMISSIPYLPAGDARRETLPPRVEKRLDELIVMIDDVLGLSRIKSGTPLGEVRALDVVSETRRVLIPYAEQASAKGITMTVDIPDQPVRVRFDAKGYELVISNLLSNALKYTESGTVSLRLYVAGTQAVTEVHDTGMGIPETEIAALFKEFFRASNARRSGIEGTGVGLAGIKDLVERFGGTMGLESTLNEGSMFRVRLPVDTEDSCALS